MDDGKTFREELAIQYPTLGPALWESDPGGLYNAVQVGDVGYIRDGYFTYLFNALSLSDGPDDLQQLQPRTSNHIRTNIDHRKYFCSKNVTTVSSEPNFGALGPDDDTQVTFSCSGKGALLYLPLPAKQEDTVVLDDFREWIVRNIHGCMRFAEKGGMSVNRMEDIILVTGRHLSKSWVKAVFSEIRGGAQVSFTAKVFYNSVVRLEERYVSGAQLRFGPTGVLPKNQCIFIRGYHVVRILKIWPKRLRARAGPAHLPEPEPEPDTRLEAIGVSNDADYQDPLHTLLEYISDQTPSCDMVLIHDNDLKCIENAKPPLETLQPDALMGFLRDYAPKIHQFQCEEFSPGKDNDSEAEVAVATVATLSYSQNAFEAPRNEGEVSHSNLISNTTSSRNDTFTGESEGLDADARVAAFEKGLALDDGENRFRRQAHTQNSGTDPSRDLNNLLQSYKDGHGNLLRHFSWLMRHEGPDNEKIHHVTAKLKGKIIGEGHGISRAIAKQVAAANALQTLLSLSPADPIFSSH